MNDDILTVYATSWCGDCHRVRSFLDRHEVEYRWVDIDETPGAEQLVLAVNRGNRSVPTLVFPDATTMTEPSSRKLAEKLGIELPSPTAR